MSEQMDLNLITTPELLDELGRRLGCEPLKLQGYLPAWAESVINVCAEVWELKPIELLTQDRNHIVVCARSSAMALLKFKTTQPQQAIADVFKMTHASVTEAVKRVENYAHKDKDFKAKFSTICKKLHFENSNKSKDAPRRTSHIAKTD